MNEAAPPSIEQDGSLYRRFRPYWLLAGGELLSDLGSNLTLFALDIWIYEGTRSVTTFASVHLFAALPSILLAPLFGAWIDRLNRRHVMMACNAGLAALTSILSVLATTGRLSVAVICVATPLFASLGTCLQLAFAAASSQIVPPDDFPRVQGIMRTVQSVSALAVPMAAGLFVVAVGLHGVLLIDLATTIVAIATAFATPLADPPVGGGARSSILREAAQGWRFVRARAGLFGMLCLFVALEFVLRMSTLLATPLVLSFASPTALGVVRSASIGGIMCGSVLLGVFGGPKKSKMVGFFWACLVNGVCVLLAGTHASVVAVAIAVFGFGLSDPVITALSTAVWQSKVPNEMLGRTYAVQKAVLSAVFPIVVVASGPLADRVFEPAMREGGALAATVGHLLGTGAGRGIGLILVCLGVFQVLATFIAWRSPHVREIERELPDAS